MRRRLLLGEIGVELLERDAEARILIGGLGLGFTLRSVLRTLGRMWSLNWLSCCRKLSAGTVSI